MTTTITFEQGTGFNPRIVRIVTTSTLAQITTAGWIDSAVHNEGFSILPSDKLLIYYDTNGTPGNAFFDVSISNGVYTLSVSEANVALPVVSGDFASFSGTSGTIADLGYSPTNAAKTKVVMAGSAVQVGYIAKYVDTAGTIDDTAGTAINAGSIQAGLSGTLGSFIAYPATAANGTFIWAAVGNAGNFNATVSPISTLGQSSVYTLPDPANAVGRILVGATATPFVSGEFAVASSTGGLMVSSGFTAANIVRKDSTNTMAAGSSIVLAKVPGTEAANAVTASGVAGFITTSALTTVAGSTYSITWTNTFITSTSVIGLTIQGGTNTVKDITFSVVPGAGTATLVIYNNSAATALDGTIIIGYSVL